MRLYWAPRTRARRVLWMLEELGQPFERVHLDIRDPASRTEAFLRVSPMGKVPALEDGATCLWDSGAICAWLADQYPQAGLAPPVGHADRGRYLQWLMFTNSVVEPAMGERVGGGAAAPGRNGWGSWDLMLRTFRDGVREGPWVLGQRFSAADVLLGMSVNFLRTFRMLESDEILFAYLDRCAARPAFQRAALAEEAGS